MLILRSSSTFTVPKGVKKIDVFCVGGGGGNCDTIFDSVSWSFSYPSLDGNLSSVGPICSANGGKGCGGVGDDGKYNGGNGGSGGGYGGRPGTAFSGNGGSDGGDGSDGYGGREGAGKGQGTTTRYFGESTGTLYAGGGGGGGWYNNNSGATNGKGGAGGGGKGIYYFEKVIAAAAPANTGGGSGGKECGGGGGGYTKTVLGASVTPGQQLSVVVGAGGLNYNGEVVGGSGICIIRWGKR